MPAAAARPGGVKLVRSEARGRRRQARRECSAKKLVTKQTGPEGREVKRVYVEAGCDIARELYLALSIDRGTGRITLIAAAEGGVEIEELAAHAPEKILRVAIDPAAGMTPFYARRLAFGLGLEGAQVRGAVEFVAALYRAFTELDASLVEINPLVVTGAGELLALDAKMGFDDNALFRHPDVEALRDEDEEDPTELEAGKHALNYVKLDGNIGCMVNGAGLAMATMDIIKLYGGSPANFLDVGGGATQGAGHRRLQADPVRPERRRHPRQHLRRHHALRRHRRGHRRGGARGQPARAAWWCGSKAPMSSSASKILAQVRPADHRRRQSRGRRARRSSRRCKEAA